MEIKNVVHYLENTRIAQILKMIITLMNAIARFQFCKNLH